MALVVEPADSIAGETANSVVTGFCPQEPDQPEEAKNDPKKSEPQEGDANESDDEVEEVIASENAVIVTASPNQALEALDPNDAPVSASCEAVTESHNMAVLDDDDDDNDGIAEDIVDDFVVKMLKGAPNKLIWIQKLRFANYHVMHPKSEVPTYKSMPIQDSYATSNLMSHVGHETIHVLVSRV